MSPAATSPVKHGVLLDQVEDSQLTLQRFDAMTKLEPIPPRCPKMTLAPSQIADSGPVPSVPARKTAYDECTIRMMFIEMDINANGNVSKDEFINYLRSRPQLQSIMYEGLDSMQSSEQLDDDGRCSPRRVRAMGAHRIIKLYKILDKDRNGVLQWEEFFGFFQQAGLLLSYATSDNPRDRMADVLGHEYQRRQVVKKWQRGGAAFGVGQESAWDLLAEDLHSKFLIDQKQAEVNTQWAAEKLAKLQHQSAKRRDALSIVADSLDAFRDASKVRGPHGRRYKIAQQESAPTTPEKPETPETVDTEMQSVADSQRSSPTVSTTPARPCTPEPQMIASEVIAENANHENLVTSSEPIVEQLPNLLTSSQIVQLPPIQLPCTNELMKPPARTPRNSRSPMRRKGRSHSSMCEKSPTKCISPTKCPQTSPKRSQSRRHTKSGRSVSPIKRGQTPRWPTETTAQPMVR